MVTKRYHVIWKMGQFSSEDFDMDLIFTNDSDIRVVMMALVSIVNGMERAGHATPMMRIMRDELKKRIKESSNGVQYTDTDTPNEEIEELLNVFMGRAEVEPTNFRSAYPDMGNYGKRAEPRPVFYGAGSMAQRIVDRQRQLRRVKPLLSGSFFTRPEENHRYIYTPPSKGAVRVNHLFLWSEPGATIKSIRIGEDVQMEGNPGLDASHWASPIIEPEVFKTIVFGEENALENVFMNIELSLPQLRRLGPCRNLTSMIKTFEAGTQFIIEWEGVINGLALLVEHSAG